MLTIAMRISLHCDNLLGWRTLGLTLVPDGYKNVKHSLTAESECLATMFYTKAHFVWCQRVKSGT